MKKTNFLLLFFLLFLVFAITGFNFDDPSFQENTKEYILLLFAIVLGAIYLFNSTPKK